MPRLHDDMRLDDVHGPEFSVRIMSVCKYNHVETVGQLRAKLDEIHKWRGLGKHSVREIKDFYLHNDSDESLFETEEYKRYKLEDVVGSVFALMHDVQNHLVRAAMKGRVSHDMRAQLKLKMLDAASRIDQLPI